MTIEEQKKLEEAAKDYADRHAFRVPFDGSNQFYDHNDFVNSKDGFIKGAEWQSLNTPIDLEKIISDAFQAGVNRALYKDHPSKKEYLQSLSLNTTIEDEPLEELVQSIEDKFIVRLLSCINKRGYDTTNCDGDTDPADIIAEWIQNTIEESKQPVPNNEFTERKKHTTQLEIIAGYRNKIVLNDLSVEAILSMLDDDYQYLEQENAVINTNEMLNQPTPKVTIEDDGWVDVPDETKKYLESSFKEAISIYGEVLTVATYGGSTFAIFKDGKCVRVNFQYYNNSVTLD